MKRILMFARSGMGRYSQALRLNPGSRLQGIDDVFAGRLEKCNIVTAVASPMSYMQDNSITHVSFVRLNQPLSSKNPSCLERTHTIMDSPKAKSTRSTIPR